MYQNLRYNFWWDGMKRGIAEFVQKCQVCQRVKEKNMRPPGLLVPLSIPEWKWEYIAMDFVTGLPRTSQSSDAIWVVADKFSKIAYFISIQLDYSLDKLAQLYMKEIVRLHGVLKSIVSDRDPRFQSNLWRSLSEAWVLNYE